MTLTTTKMHRYSNRQFRSLEDYPSENTLTVNLTHQQLTTLAPPFKRLVAIAPSRYEEGHISPTHDPKGYDVKLETAKELVFQHKAPDNTVVRNGKQWLNYKIDTRQLKILAKYYSPREAYIALPATPQKREVRQGLERTIFVDIWPLFIIQTARSNDISRIYVEYCTDPNEIPDVKGRFNSRKRKMNGYPYWDMQARDSIFSDAITWEPLEQELKGCTLGLPIRGHMENYRFTGLEENPPGFNSELYEAYHSAYVGHIQRRHAVNRYIQNPNERQVVLDWLIDSLQYRLEIAQQLDYQIRPRDRPEFTFRDNEGIREQLEADLNELAETSRFPEWYIRDTQRYIIERGDDSNPLTV